MSLHANGSVERVRDDRRRLQVDAAAHLRQQRAEIEILPHAQQPLVEQADPLEDIGPRNCGATGRDRRAETLARQAAGAADGARSPARCPMCSRISAPSRMGSRIGCIAWRRRSTSSARSRHRSAMRSGRRPHCLYGAASPLYRPSGNTPFSEGMKSIARNTALVNIRASPLWA